MPPRPPRGLRSRARPNASQRGLRGQAALMTYLFATVIVISAIALFRTGRITTDKMQLQNAADSLAYSVSTVEARDLNFAAYTNRAIIANEVAIGQAIGMASRAYHWKSIGDFLLEYNKYLTGPTLGISNTVLTPLATGFQVPGGIFVSIMRGYAKAMAAVNHNINKVYGISQQVYHLASLINSLGLLEESLEANAPDGARMSNYGVLMLVAHLATYGALPVPVDEQFTQSYSPKLKKSRKRNKKKKSQEQTLATLQSDTAGATDTGGYGRLSALIHNSGDPFTKGWHNPPYHLDDDLNGRGWTINFFKMMAEAGMLPRPERIGFTAGPISGYGEFGVYDAPPPGGWLGFTVGGGLDLGVIGADVEFYIMVQFTMAREGGSEIRAVIPIAGPNKKKVAGELFSWSSADATNFGLGFRGGGGFDAWLRLPFVGKVDLISARVGMALTTSPDNLFIGFSFGGGGEGCSTPDDPDEEPQCESVEDSADIVIYDGPFPASAPLGAAFVQAAPRDNALQTHKKHMGTDAKSTFLPFPAPKGPVSTESYGEAPGRLLGWYYPPSLPAAGIYWQPSVFPDRNVSTSYKGLPRYMDTTGAEPIAKSGGPFLIVGLEIGEDTVEAEHYDEHAGKKPVGRFDMNEAFGNDKMTAIAKSEVRFERPLDIAWFARGDGYVEHGSAFNPYWQASLVETSHADRVMALLLQHGELAQTVAFGSELGGLADWLSNALGL